LDGQGAKNSGVETARLRERTKRDFSTAQTDTFAGEKVEEEASVCFGRNDRFVMMLTGGQACIEAARLELLFD
jgi:hypothetical protein